MHQLGRVMQEPELLRCVSGALGVASRSAQDQEGPAPHPALVVVAILLAAVGAVQAEALAVEVAVTAELADIGATEGRMKKIQGIKTGPHAGRYLDKQQDC